MYWWWLVIFIVLLWSYCTTHVSRVCPLPQHPSSPPCSLCSYQPVAVALKIAAGPVSLDQGAFGECPILHTLLFLVPFHIKPTMRRAMSLLITLGSLHLTLGASRKTGHYCHAIYFVKQGPPERKAIFSSLWINALLCICWLTYHRASRINCHRKKTQFFNCYVGSFRLANEAQFFHTLRNMCIIVIPVNAMYVVLDAYR